MYNYLYATIIIKEKDIQFESWGHGMSSKEMGGAQKSKGKSGGVLILF